VRNFDWLSFTPLWSPSPVLHSVTYVNLIFSNMTNAPSFFLGEEDFTHATQDRDHGAPSS
jgi:hypothetical protein